MTALEKLQALARRRRMPEPEPTPAPPPAPDPAPDAAPPLGAAIRFDVPSVGDVWLVADDDARQRLIDQGEPQGRILTAGELALLEPFSERERVEILHWKITMNARALTAAPAPARRYGPGERGWQRWRMENLDRQIAEYRREKG